MATMTKSKTVGFGNFKPLTAKSKYRLVFRSWGLDKTGKNHFGFTGPGPIFGLYFDPGGIEGMAEKFVRGDESVGGVAKEIHTCFYRFRKAFTQDEAVAVRDQFSADYEVALNNARTIQYDETEYWECARFAEFGRESAKGREYGPINGAYRGMLQDAYDAGVNLQLIQKVKESWENDKPTGIMEPTGFKGANYIVQASLEHSWTEDHLPEESGFSVKIVNCRQNMTLGGQDFAGLDLPTLGQIVYADSTPEDWA